MGQVVRWSRVANLDIAKSETELDGPASGKGKNLLYHSLAIDFMSNIYI